MWLLILSLCVCFTTITSLMFCLCWRKKTPKNDLLGLHGMVTQKNPDENVNHLPSVVAPCVVDGGNITANSVDIIDANKRITTTCPTSVTTTITATNTRRSLPDIPSEQVDSSTIVNWEPVDNSSEHYATVEQYQNSKLRTIPNGVETTISRPSISQHSSISQADDSSFSPYEKVKYDKIKKKQEHPYAQLQPTTTIPTTTTTRQILEETINTTTDERTNLLRIDGANNEPAAPSRSRRSSSSTHSGLGVDIPAATAVAGGIAASPELPYMTPPVTQSNFSGDSQDSSKGYTSISVREPLANILAQTKQLHNKKRELDPHYSTVSDDSDDVYTTIPDSNNQIYTSESETYARIPPLPITVEAEVNPTPTRCLNNVETDINDEFYEPAPQPPLPGVDSFKQVTNYTHSRQASSSSSVANLGSPKPEKRQANSPLPPPPPPTTGSSKTGSSSSLSFDFHIDNNKLQNYRNIDDLYAKVHKNKRKDESDNDQNPSPDKNRRKSCDNFNNRKSAASSTASNDNNNDNNNSSGSSRKCKEHNYETLKKNSNNNNNDVGYEQIKHEEPGYASINGPDSITSSDPGYEILKQRPPSEIDPNYEELQHKTTTSTIIDGYSVINKKNKVDKSRTTTTSSSYGSNSQDLSIDEPNYESMPSEPVSEHNYAGLKSNNSSDTDPNYESVNSDRNSYEKVKKLDGDDGDDDEPPYERLNDDDSSRTNTDSVSDYEKINHHYQSVDTSESSNGGNNSGGNDKQKSDPPYERLVDDNGDCDVVPGYEKVKFSEASNNNNNNEPNYATIKDDHSLLEENAIFQV